MATSNVSPAQPHVNGSTLVAELDWSDVMAGNFPASPARTAWREAVDAVAAKAKAALPDANGRIAAAVKIVLAGDVELLEDGTAKVASQSHGTTKYYVVNGVCECPDAKKAPAGFCKHRLAYGIHKRAKQLVAEKLQDLSCTPAHTATPQDAPKAAIAPTDDASVIPTTPSASWAVTEAPISSCIKLRCGAVEWTHTVRCCSEAELRTRLSDFRTLVQDMSTELNTLAAQLEAAHRQLHAASSQPPTPPTTPTAPAPTPGPAEGWCPVHHVQMSRQSNGRGSWWSHKLHDGSWCKGK